MKILLGTHYLAKTGGTENYTYALAMELKRLGHDVEYFANVRGKTSSLLEEKGVPFMSGERYDLILANHMTVVEKLWPYGFIIQTCHGNIAELEQPSPYADAYVAVSEEVREHLLSKGFQTAAVIANGIDCNRFFPKKPVSAKLQTVLSLCQSDEANDFIRRCCERGNIRFLQSNKFTDNVWSIEDMINESDLVVGLGRSAFDAMACGRAVLVYDYRQYMGEFLGDGMLTPESIGRSMRCNCSGRASRLKYDEQAFIAEMQKYSPELAAWGREYALKNLNIEKATEKYLDVYRNLDINKSNFGTYKARWSKLLGEAHRELKAALCDNEQLQKQLQERLAEQQRQTTSLQKYCEAKSRKHLRAIRGLVWLCIALAVTLLAFVFI